MVRHPTPLSQHRILGRPASKSLRTAATAAVRADGPHAATRRRRMLAALAQATGLLPTGPAARWPALLGR